MPGLCVLVLMRNSEPPFMQIIHLTFKHMRYTLNVMALSLNPKKNYDVGKTMSPMDELFTAKLLNLKLHLTNAETLDNVLKTHPDISENEDFKNVCAKMPKQLCDRIDQAIDTLGISKRLFVQTAIEASLCRYEELYSELDIETANGCKS